MKFETPLLRGRLVKRYKRFLADIALPSGHIVTAHCPNPGRMLTCSAPDSIVWISTANNKKRKLKYTLEIIETADSCVGVNPMLANAIVKEAILADALPELTGWQTVNAEVRYGENSRVDFVLECQKRKLYLEVKSTTYVENNVALFPDAETLRGQKHLKELMHVVDEGRQAAIFFLIQRMDASLFRAADHIDPAYAQLLRRAHEKGVQVLAYDCSVAPEEIAVRRRVEWDETCPVGRSVFHAPD